MWILDTQFGVVNHYLGYLGIPPVPWLTSVHWSLIGVSIASIWWDMGLAFVLFLAALQDVPHELHEAAQLDGANAWLRFRHVTLPHIRPTVSMVVTLQLIATMRIFSQVYVMTNGGPAGGSLSVIYYVYQTGVVQFLLGLASAVSTLLFIAILLVTLVQRFDPAGDGPCLTSMTILRRPIPGTKLALRDVPLWLVGMFFVLLWAAPFVWMVSTSFKPSSQVMTRDVEWIPRVWTLANYQKVLTYPIATWAMNSLIVAVVATALCVLFGAMAGYAIARLRFPGRNFVFLLFLASIMIPPEVGVVPLLLAMIKIGWASTYQALILPLIGNVLAVYIFRQFFLGFPREIEEAAIMDGAGRFTIFFRIALPLARAPMIAATVIVFTLNWNNFLWPLLVTFDDSMKTMPVGIAAFAPVVGTQTQLDGFATSMAAVTLLCIPSVVLFLLLQRHFIQGITLGGVKG